jgi:hypothetical protein
MTTIEKLISLASEIAWRQVEFARLKQRQRESGQSVSGVTVYAVRETTVRRHVRKGFTAVRVGRAKG